MEDRATIEGEIGSKALLSKIIKLSMKEDPSWTGAAAT